MTAYIFSIPALQASQCMSAWLLQQKPYLKNAFVHEYLFPKDYADMTFYIYKGFFREGWLMYLIKSFTKDELPYQMRLTTHRVDEACEALVAAGKATALRGLQGELGSADYRYWYGQFLSILMSKKALAEAVGIFPVCHEK